MGAAVSIATGRRFRLRVRQVSEHAEQVALFKWARLMERQYPELALLYANMNGATPTAIMGHRMNAAGRKRGVPDLCLPVARGPWHGCYLELKRRDGGTLSDAQGWWLTQLQQQHYYAVVASGWEHAALVLTEYLEA